MREYIYNLCRVLNDLPFGNLGCALEILESVERQQIFVAGNGGSAATANHLTEDLVTSAGIRAISLSSNAPLITAVANDNGYDEVFSKQLQVLGQPGDVLIVFSGSGNSPNIVRAVEVANQMQMKTIAFLGMGGGHVGDMVDVSIIVPSDEYGPIEDVHMALCHLITVNL